MITGYEIVPANNEQALQKAVANQQYQCPLMLEVMPFNSTQAGIFTRDCLTELDHCVTAVVYGTSKDGINFWPIKNSSGTGWGEKQ
ncbi:hypothetical protein REPUB_Repub09cG0075500 [Reevesia pubescens]